MHEIKCPKCGEVFTVDESGYAAIVGQVRDEEFHRELAQREKEKQEAQQRQDALDKLPETLAALQAAQADADALNVDQAYRLTLLELGITE